VGPFRRSTLSRQFAAPLIAVAVVAGCGGTAKESKSAADRGANLVESYGCRSCHSNSAGGVGPDWARLAGSRVTLANGRTTVANREYLVRAILDPDADVVAGYSSGVMADAVGGRITRKDASAIVAYLETLER